MLRVSSNINKNYSEDGGLSGNARLLTAAPVINFYRWCILLLLPCLGTILDL